MQFSLLALRPYRHLLACRLSEVMANQMLAVALGWQMYDLTHSAFKLGLIGMLQFAPQLLLMLPSGHVADHYDRRRIMAWTQAVQALIGFTLALLGWRHQITPDTLFMAALALGVVDAFQSPCRAALTPALVGEAHLSQALALNAVLLRGAVIGGPALGGLIYGLGSGAVYLSTGLCWVAACVAIASAPLQARSAPPERAERPKASWQSMLAGIQFIRQKKIILAAISLDLFAVLLGDATVLLPVYARTILLVGPVGLGVLRAAPAVGALIMSLILTQRPVERQPGRAMLLAFAVFGVATIVFGLSRNLGLSVLALAVFGAADMVSMVVRSALVQLETPDALRGRVSSVNSLFIGASNLLGDFQTGLAASLLGTVPAVVVGGLGTLLVAALWARLFPQLTAANPPAVAS